jgi:hypothetical protein
MTIPSSESCLMSGVAVVVGVWVAVTVKVGVTVGVTVHVWLGVAVWVMVWVADKVAVIVHVFVKVGVAVPVGVAVIVAVRVKVRVAVLLAVAVGVAVYVTVAVAVFDGEDVADWTTDGVALGTLDEVFVAVAVGAMHEAVFTSVETNVIRSIFGPPSAVIAAMVISFLPASRFTVT